jgi:transposase-like protein
MSTYSEATKAMVLAQLAMGGTVNGVSHELGIPRTTVRRWRTEAGDLIRPSVDPKKDSALGSLLADYLAGGLDSLTAQTKAFADSTWLRQQSARDLALLHGISFDKVFRVLAAVEPESA